LDYEHFIATVQHEAGIPKKQAERAVAATLSTLAERISGGEAGDIAKQLPTELRRLLADGSNAQAFDLEEFLRRVAEREGVTLDNAEQHARAVFSALGRTVGHDEIADMASELPQDFEPLVAAAQSRPAPADPPPAGVVMRFEDFIERVARRSGLARDEAVRATQAVLEALGERISKGQVDDLAARLPAELEQPLKRGTARSKGAARPLSLDEFVRAIANREGSTPEQAQGHAGSVFATLREVVGEKEFADTVAQLPKDYAPVLARPY
jgi:uncharacterized protein (DUF2267 family)